MTEPALGEIRLQWWLESIDAIYAGETFAHPVIEELAAAIEQGELPNGAFQNMIRARRFDIYDDPMPTPNDLEGYLGDTASAIIQLSAMILDRDYAKSCGEVSGLAGVAMGVSGILRSLPLDRARGRCFVPVEMLAPHDLTPSDLIAGRPEDRLADVLGEFRTLGKSRLEEARAKQLDIPPPVFPAFLSVALTQLYLDRLKRMGTDCLRQTAEVSQLRRQFRLYRSARAGKF